MATRLLAWWEEENEELSVVRENSLVLSSWIWWQWGDPHFYHCLLWESRFGGHVELGIIDIEMEMDFTFKEDMAEKRQTDGKQKWPQDGTLVTADGDWK